MRRPTTLIVFVLVILAGGILYSVAYKVSALEEKLITLNKKIGKSKSDLSKTLPETSTIRPKLKPLAPTYVSEEIKLASQSNSISLDSSKLTHEKNKLDAALREIFSKSSLYTASKVQ